MNKKRLMLVVALVLLVAGVVVGTIAWLTDTTDEVKNTFTTSDIDITLTESENLNLKMVPGHVITKDPVVTVEADSEACYLFVKLDKSANFDSFLTYSMADGWTQGNGTDIPSNVFYRTVASSSADQEFAVLKNNEVTVLGTVTKEMMNGLTAETYPTLTITAYASQQYKAAGTEFTAKEAWDNVNP
ncbi:MAG: SipW-dependent-type signal peptide-containing protein [Bacillota bacterium]|nr:SipW-dependent-type signal peptide-containing protein [Bacillota bacterium]